MTDKQIIIDGIDVAGCVRLQDDEKQEYTQQVQALFKEDNE